LLNICHSTPAKQTQRAEASGVICLFNWGIMGYTGDAMASVLLAGLVLGFLIIPGSAQIITTGPAGTIEVPLTRGADGEPITLPYVIDTSPATASNYKTNGTPLQISKGYNGFSGGSFIGYAGSIFPSADASAKIVFAKRPAQFWTALQYSDD
jgi:hypothetical protein